MHILSPETDNCPWISGRERMTVENISWSISTKECCRPRRGLIFFFFFFFWFGFYGPFKNISLISSRSFIEGGRKPENPDWLIVLGFNDTSTLEGHFVSSPREREKRDRRESRDEREGQGSKRNRNESEETEEIKTFPLYPYPLQG